MYHTCLVLALNFRLSTDPAMSEGFSVPPPRYGNDTFIQEILAEQLGLECCTLATGDGEKILVMVDNIRDPNYYDPLDPAGRTYVAGFVSPLFTEYHDRNIFVLDAFDWLHRTGDNPPDDSRDPAYMACAEEQDRPKMGEPEPLTYESIFAHEYYVRIFTAKTLPLSFWILTCPFL